MIVMLYFGSVEKFDEVQRSITEVAKLVKLSYRTVQYILERFVRDGHQMICHYRGQAKPWNGKLDESHRAYLLQKETLQSWAGFSLKWRCQQFFRDKGIQIAPPSL